MRFVRGRARRRAATARSCRPAQHAGGAARRRHRGPLRGRGRRRRRRASRACAGKPAPDTFLAGAPRRSASSRRRRRSSRTRSPGSRPGAPARFGWVVGVDRGGQADALRDHGADVVVERPRRAAGGRTRDRAAASSRSTRGRSASASCDLDLLGADRVDLRAVQRAHRAARQPRRGRAARVPGTYLNGFYEPRPLPYAEARLRLPRGRPDDRSTSRTARSCGCSSTTSRSTCATGRCSRHERVLDLRDGVLRREVEWRSPAGPGGPRALARGSSRSSSARSPRSSTRSRPVEASARIVVQSELVANEPVPERPTTRARPPRCARRCVGEQHGHHELRRGARAPHARQRAAHGRRHGPRRRRAGGHGRPRPRASADLARVTVSDRARARARRCGS